MTTKITKIFILIILFYGNKQCLCGVCMMIFMCIVTFKRLLLVWKGVMRWFFMRIVTFKNYSYYGKWLCVCLGDGVKCVIFVSMLSEHV